MQNLAVEFPKCPSLSPGSPHLQRTARCIVLKSVKPKCTYLETYRFHIKLVLGAGGGGRGTKRDRYTDKQANQPTSGHLKQP